MKKANVKKNVLENWFTVQDVNLAAGVELYNLYGYSWKNDQELYFNNGRQFCLYNPTTKKGKKLADLAEDAENATLEPITGHVAFTRSNKLYIQGADGEKIIVTSNENKGIVSGQTIARSEFEVGRA